MSLTAQEGPDARLPFLILSPSLFFPDRQSFPTRDSCFQAADPAVSLFVAGALITVTPQSRLSSLSLG